MKRVGLWDDIGSIRSALTNHTESLMFNLNNNAAENYNSILAKFVGGKKVNLCLRGSYELRCNAAVTAYNVGANRLSLFHKQVAQKSPGLFTKRYIKKSMQLSDSRRRCKLFAPAAQRLKTKILVGPDENYGAVEPDLDSYPDLSLSELNDKKILYLNTLKLTKEEIIALEKSTKRQHECEDWHRERKKRLTASVFGKICKLRKTTSRAKTIESLLYGTFQGNLATKYGVEHEEVAKEQLANILGVNIEPSGLFVDSEQFYLAASPDGLIGDDGLMEIKCPSSAKSVSPKEAIENKIIKCCDDFYPCYKLTNEHFLFVRLKQCSIAVFVRKSYLRINKWETTSKYKFMSIIGETRWAKDRCLDEIYNTPNFTSDVRFKAKVYVDSFLKYETIILSQIFLQIFSSTTPLSLYLQTKGLDIFQANKMVKQTTNTLNEQSRNFENILEASNTFTEWANMTFNDRHLGLNIPREFTDHRISRKKIMVGEISKDDPTINQVNKYRIDIFNMIYDQIINSIKQRFSKHEIFSSISILDLSNFVSTLNLSHIDIAKRLIKLTSILNKFNPSLTVGTFTEEIKDFASKWSKIKQLADDDDQKKL
ncbi:hypothetical protein QTP88_027539 [Uroleucon formosanum]